ncbi:MAG: hypothetical protein NZ108_10210, partial [Bacteroidia bacterium]|nr:hypothetical protein [Bacteroidia bacterium]
INEKIKSNSSNSGTSRRENSSSTSSSSSMHSGCADACADQVCMNVGSYCFEFIFLKLFGDYHNEILKKESQNARISSLEIWGLGGYNAKDAYYQGIPRIRGNWGFYSTDFRAYWTLEQRLNFLDTYKTFDWQVLVLNLIASKQFNLRWGNGFMLESYSINNTDALGNPAPGVRRLTKLQYEVTLQGELFLQEDKIRVAAEGRYAPPIEQRYTPRVEASAQLAYRLFQSNRFSFYLTAGAMTSRMYTVPIYSALGGLYLRVD